MPAELACSLANLLRQIMFSGSQPVTLIAGYPQLQGMPGWDLETLQPPSYVAPVREVALEKRGQGAQFSTGHLDDWSSSVDTDGRVIETRHHWGRVYRQVSSSPFRRPCRGDVLLQPIITIS